LPYQKAAAIASKSTPTHEALRRSPAHSRSAAFGPTDRSAE
jgi:hypothetical protein